MPSLSSTLLYAHGSQKLARHEAQRVSVKTFRNGGTSYILKYPDGSISKLEPMVALDDMEAAISLLRDILDAA